MGIKLNPAYFGPSRFEEQFDLTNIVYEMDGSRRNLPLIQFEIALPTGTRYFVTYRNGFDPPSNNEATVA